MHELSIAENLLEIIDNYRSEQKFKRCNSVTVRVGLLSAVDEDALRFAFDSLVEETVDQGAVLNVEMTYPRASCDCGCEFEVTDMIYTCPQCGAPTRPHHVCLACGTYRGVQVIEIEEE